MARYISKPSEIEAVQWTGVNNVEVIDFGVQTLMHQRDGFLYILAGKEGAQKYVPVPVGHWIVRQPGDLTDHWPVDPDYFAQKYEVFSPDMRVYVDDACEAADHPNAKPHPIFLTRGVCECEEALYSRPPSQHRPECAFGSGWPKREVGGDPLCICTARDESRADQISLSRLPGHELLHEGAAYYAGERGMWRPHLNGVGGEGYGRCSCGAVSGWMLSGAARKRWHREHKRALITGVTECPGGGNCGQGDPTGCALHDPADGWCR